MKWIIILIMGLSLMAFLGQQSLASEKYTIRVLDSNNNAAKEALVTIWDGDVKLDSDYTDSNGLWDTRLESSTSYRITATKNNQFGERVVTPGNTYTITIHMN
jgi:hypothetical protein